MICKITKEKIINKSPIIAAVSLFFGVFNFSGYPGKPFILYPEIMIKTIEIPPAILKTIPKSALINPPGVGWQGNSQARINTVAGCPLAGGIGAGFEQS